MTTEQPNSYAEAVLSLPSDVETPASVPNAADVFDAREICQRQVLDLLQHGVEGIFTSEGYQAYLKTMAKFHQYSFANSLLIHAQNPDATQVAGYRKWQAMDRQVRKGEHAIKIFYPMFRVGEEENPNTGAREQRRYLAGYGVGNVFDIAQTDGEPLPEGPTPIDNEDVNEASRELNKRLSRFGIDRGFRMESRVIHGNARGLWSPRENAIIIRKSICIDPETGEEEYVADPLNAAKTKTLAHELAHAVAGHNGQVEREDAEVVAESTAFVTMQHFGLETGDYSFPYLASWAGDAKRLRANLSEVQRVSNILIAAAEGTDPTESDFDPLT